MNLGTAYWGGGNAQIYTFFLGGWGASLSMKLSFYCYSLLRGVSSGGLSTHSKRMFVLTAALTIAVSEVGTKK